MPLQCRVSQQELEVVSPDKGHIQKKTNISSKSHFEVMDRDPSNIFKMENNDLTKGTSFFLTVRSFFLTVKVFFFDGWSP